MLDGQNIKIAMTLLPPGTIGEPVKTGTIATIPSDDKINLWVQEENAEGWLYACGCPAHSPTKRLPCDPVRLPDSVQFGEGMAGNAKLAA